MTFDVSSSDVARIVSLALEEDIGSGDITSDLCVRESTVARAQMIAKESLRLAGVELLPLIFTDCSVRILKKSGDQLNVGDIAAQVEGPARSLLKGERVALNFVQRLSGVATLAAAYVREMAGTKCRVLDTRKTTPGLRRLEKMAAAAGGATNHRAGLYDAVLIKNNHITAGGGVRAALERTRGAGVPVEIEVRTWDELKEALECGATHLLLDNLTPEDAKRWIAHIGGRATVELSGGITLANVRSYAVAGADYVSSGAITHSARAMDISFRLELK
jgi:nicotinate-nucleotide pyrophosphorylase (carboxylating)